MKFTKKPMFQDDNFVDEDDEVYLSCPSCGFEYIHQCGVEYWSRKEDEDNGLLTRIVTLIFSRVIYCILCLFNIQINRRDDMLIKFWCEQCYDDEGNYIIHHLAITQREGHTILYWVD